MQSCLHKTQLTIVKTDKKSQMVQITAVLNWKQYKRPSDIYHKLYSLTHRAESIEAPLF